MIRALKLRSGADHGRLSAVKDVAKACLPRTLGVRWLLPSAERRLLLTFDDGPDAVHTPKVLDALDGMGARAIFFVVGDFVRKNPSLLEEIVERGHVVGNHSHTHPRLPELDAARVREEFKRCQDAVADAIGFEPAYFRPPYGEQSLTAWRTAQGSGLQTVLWSNESGEYGVREGASVDEIAFGLASSLLDSQIVLLHDDTQIVVELLSNPTLRGALEPYQLAFDISESLSGVAAGVRRA